MQPTENQDQHPAHSEPEPPPPPVNSEIPAETRERNTSDYKQPSNPNPPVDAPWWRWDLSVADTLGLIFNGAVTVATIIGIYFLISQTNEMRRANNLSSESLLKTQEAISIAQDANRIAREVAVAQHLIDREQIDLSRANNLATVQAVKAAQEANANSTDAFKADQRPWLLVSSIKITDPQPKDGTMAEVVLSNLGKSPALKVRTNFLIYGAFRSDTLPPPTPRNLRAEGPGIEMIRENPLVRDPLNLLDVYGPSVSRTFILANSLGSKMLETIGVGGARIFVRGQITYTDVFGVDHLTAFCYGARRRTQPPVGSFDLTACDEGNRAR